ncbi:DNA methyltransferase [Mesorhizobium sp. WSM4935]|uniref:DNA-methyltransferase n=1 Tax=Mesorhizobium sp. WSM4935 TaxID=3038547 RepID=UPI002415753B|nr:DNA methyltransferase [Mesorhizobium sp. WSM4935]MDG4877633.1 DNA methyltransferase [Mesorhizobium sp. WSM4935]
MIEREEIIGDCRLIQGDCRTVLATIAPVGAVITDPPFEKEAHTPIRRTQRSIRENRPAELGFPPITAELRTRLPEWAATNCTGWLLAFCQVEAVSAWRDAMQAAGLKYKRGMAWVKPDSSPQFNGQMPAQGYECIATGWCGQGRSSWNGGGRRGVFTHITNQPDRDGRHPTEKPLPLMQELVSLFSTPSDVVLDPFMGSGSTGVASVRTGRQFIGIEINAQYFEVACERIRKAYAQPDMFVDRPPEPRQETLL